jgi:hypothetical protein
MNASTTVQVLKPAIQWKQRLSFVASRPRLALLNRLMLSSIHNFFLLERPNLFAICNNTFSKWWEG